MTSRLESLPAELLDSIIDLAVPRRTWLERKEAIKTSCAISLTSRTLSSIGRPYLYRFIKIGDIGLNVRPLLRTLSRQPVLAAHVKELDFRFSCKVWNPMDLDDLDQCWLMAEQMIGKNALSLKAKSELARSSGCRVWEIAILLALTTRLRKLVFSMCYRESEEPTPCIHCPDLGGVLTTIFAASQLQEVHILGEWHEGLQECFNFTVLARPLAIPSITKLVCTGANNRHCSRFPCPPRTSNVLDLHLRHCQLNAECISQLLSACKALDSVTIDWDEGQSRVALDVLIISDCWNDTRFGPHDERRIFAKGLSQFQQITTLYLEETLLFGSVIWRRIEPHELSGDYALTLPPALRNFIIHSKQELEDLPNMLAAIRLSLPPSVRNVQIVFDWYPRNGLAGKCFNNDTFEPVASVEWSIHPMNALRTQFEDNLTFQCFADNRPAEMPLGDVVRLAENGGGIDAVLSYLYRPKDDHPGSSSPRPHYERYARIKLGHWESRPELIGGIENKYELGFFKVEDFGLAE